MRKRHNCKLLSNEWRGKVKKQAQSVRIIACAHAKTHEHEHELVYTLGWYLNVKKITCNFKNMLGDTTTQYRFEYQGGA